MKKKLDAHTDILTAGMKAQHEKLVENLHKKPITILSLEQSIKLMKGEIWELQEELDAHEVKLEDVRRELADIMNFAASAIYAINKELEGEND